MDELEHTCNKDKPGKPLPFGRPDPEGKCLRCKELAGGAEARGGWNSKADEDARRAREISAHFKSERHLTGRCGSVCTFGDW